MWQLIAAGTVSRSTYMYLTVIRH